jgi:heme oxygenase
LKSLDAELIAVRAHIAEQTQAIHQELHNNPILQPLTDPTVTAPQYFAAIGVFRSFYDAIELERRRHDTWDDFSLTAECDALKADTTGQKTRAATLAFATRLELLGGLYVAHGASFGRSLFRQNLQNTIPDAPKMFVAMRTSKATWRTLIDTMERYGQNPATLHEIERGAAKSFETVKRLSQSSA